MDHDPRPVPAAGTYINKASLILSCLLLLPGWRLLHHKLPPNLLLLLLPLLPRLLLLLPWLLALVLPWLLLLLLALMPRLLCCLLWLASRWLLLLLLLLGLGQVLTQPCADVGQVLVHLLCSSLLCQPHLMKLLS
jgi:hypothetical protein